MSKRIIPHSCWRCTAEVMLLFHDKHLLSSQHKLFLTAPDITLRAGRHSTAIAESHMKIIVLLSLQLKV